jgi:formamidopyrimidine-DNA glycosylase
MPELPDIAAYIHALEPRIVGRKLIGIRLNTPFVLRTVSPAIQDVAGRKIESLERIGKRIAFHLEGDYVVVIHLMIAGRFQWKGPHAKLPGKLALAAFDFDDGTLILTEAGSRRRASIHIVQSAESLSPFHRGGVEPLETTLGGFREALTRENHTLKRALTDPRLFSGIGNAYSDEILHRARLSPVKLTSRLTEGEINALYHATQDVLSEWIHRLSAESDKAFPTKVTAFREGMSVHGRFRQPCPVCGDPVQRITYADNECDYCPTCQTGGKLLADRGLSRLLKSDWPRSLAELEDLKSRHSSTA